MKRFLNPAATVVLALLLVATGAAPAPAASYEYDRLNACRPTPGPRAGCSPGIVVKTWNRKGAKARGVGWVYASTERVGKRKVYTARWYYQRPGGKMTAATGWKKAMGFPDASFVETHWGRDGRSGPQYPVGTKICIDFRETGQPLCVRLK